MGQRLRDLVAERRPKGQGTSVNQAVIRIYLLIATLALALVFAVWPRCSGFSRLWSAVRFGGVLALGGAFVLFGFHTPGQIRNAVLERAQGEVRVLEVYEGRRWRNEVWTSLDLEDGRVRPSQAPSRHEAPTEPEPMMRVRPRMRGRVERRLDAAEGDPWVEVGPLLDQPILAVSGPRYVVVSAREAIGRPETVYVARVELDGTVRWRASAEALGLESGRLRRAVALPDGDVVVVFSCVRSGRGLFEVLSQAEHVCAARIGASDGQARWKVAF